MKLNTDAASSSNLGSFGVVIRAKSGEFSIAAAERIEVAASVISVEVGALLRGLQLAADLDIRFLEVESDSLSLIQLLNSPSNSISAIGSIIDDIYHFAQVCNVISFRFSPRKSIGVADRLANLGLSLPSPSNPCNCVDSPPDSILDVLFSGFPS